MNHSATYRLDRVPLVSPSQADLHAADMTATFSAGLTLGEAQSKLAEISQFLPIDGDPSRTLQQLIETNSTGPLRLGYGAWRDLLLGCQFQNGKDELVTAGGRTVKNVAGYDLTKFMIGQRGIFGRLVTVTTRTYRRPVAALLARFAPDAHLINRLLPSPCRPQWLAHTSEATWCGYLGDQRTIDYYRNALPGHQPMEVIERSVDDDIDHRARLWQCAGVEDCLRAAVPPANVLDFVRAAELSQWCADGAFGIVIGLSDRSGHQRIRDAAQRAGGSVYFVEGGRARAELDSPQRALLERLKAAFDPQGKLKALE